MAYERDIDNEETNLQWRTKINDKFLETISVSDFGATGDGSTDDTAAIQDAIDTVYNAGGGRVLMMGGTYLVSSPILLRDNVCILGESKYTTTIKLADGSDCNVIDTENFASLTGTSPSSALNSFAIKNISIDGNRANNYSGVASTSAQGFGIRLYAYNYEIDNVRIGNCAGVGFYSEFSPTNIPETAYDNARFGNITNLHITYCSYEGFYFRGPADIYVNNIIVGYIYQPTRTGSESTALNSLISPTKEIDAIVFERSANNASGTAEIGFMHGFHARDGRCVRLSGTSGQIRIVADNIEAEGGRGNMVIEGDVQINISKITTRNNEFGDANSGRADLELSYTAGKCVIDSVMVHRTSATQQNPGVVFDGADDTYIGSIFVDGNEYAGHGVMFSGICRYSGYGHLEAQRLVGTAHDTTDSTGLVLSGDNDLILGETVLTDCDLGLEYAMIGRCSISSLYIRGDDAASYNFTTTPSFDIFARGSVTLYEVSKKYYGNFSYEQSVDTGSTGVQTFVIDHDFYRTPSYMDCKVSVRWGGASPPELGFFGVKDITSTQITLMVDVKTASTGTMTLSLEVS